MNQVKVLTLELAERFLKEGFSIREFTQIEDEAAEALANYKGHLYLNCLVISCPETLANHNHEGHLHLDGLTSLSDKAAKALVNFKGNLHLRGLTSMSEDCASIP